MKYKNNRSFNRHSDRDNVVTPANWFPGMPVILPYPKTYKELKNKVKKCSNANSDYSCMDWYLCFVPDKNCKKDSSKSKIKTPSSKNSRPEITNPKFQPCNY